MRHAPIIAFVVWSGLVSAFAYLIGDAAWSRGAGDGVLVVSAFVVLALILWERKLRASDRPRRPD